MNDKAKKIVNETLQEFFDNLEYGDNGVGLNLMRGNNYSEFLSDVPAYGKVRDTVWNYIKSMGMNPTAENDEDDDWELSRIESLCQQIKDCFSEWFSLGEKVIAKVSNLQNLNQSSDDQQIKENLDSIKQISPTLGSNIEKLNKIQDDFEKTKKPDTVIETTNEPGSYLEFSMTKTIPSGDNINDRIKKQVCEEMKVEEKSEEISGKLSNLFSSI